MPKETQENQENDSFLAKAITWGLVAFGIYVLTHGDQVEQAIQHVATPASGSGAPQPNNCTPFVHDHIQSISQVGYHFKNQDTMSCDAFVAALKKGRNGTPSPAASEAVTLYRMLRWRKFDPGAALAIFTGESQMGTDGVGGPARNWGNMQSSWMHHENLPELGPDAVFPTWEDGLKNWMDMIDAYTAANHTSDVPTILKIITPSSPSSGFIDTVEWFMREFNNPSQAFDGSAVAEVNTPKGRSV